MRLILKKNWGFFWYSINETVTTTKSGTNLFTIEQRLVQLCFIKTMSVN